TRPGSASVPCRGGRRPSSPAGPGGRPGCCRRSRRRSPRHSRVRAACSWRLSVALSRRFDGETTTVPPSGGDRVNRPPGRPQEGGRAPTGCPAPTRLTTGPEPAMMHRHPTEEGDMPEEARITKTMDQSAVLSEAAGQPCTMVIFGASGDLTKRLLMPALYNLACDRLLPKGFCLIGVSLDEFTTEQFRDKMSTDIKQCWTRKTFDEPVWKDLVRRFYYMTGRFDDPKVFERLNEQIAKLGAEWKTEDNILYYYATPPVVFGMISENLAKVGGNKGQKGWRRVIVEKPFGHDLA